jgi:hypothetical protein
LRGTSYAYSGNCPLRKAHRRAKMSECTPTAVDEFSGILKRTPGVNKVNRTPGTIMSAVVTLSLKPYLMIRKLIMHNIIACIDTCVNRLEFGGIANRKTGLSSANKSAGVSTFGAVMSIIYISV